MVEDTHDHGVVTRGPGNGNGLVGEGLAPVEWAALREGRTKGREH